MEEKRIKIGKRFVGEGCPSLIIAEAGVNHNGSLKLAKKMIDAAKMAGAGAIKFQTFITEELVTQDAPKANYQKKATGSKSQYEMLKKLELSERDFKELFNYCKRRGIMFLSTPFDSKSAEFLLKLGVPAFKIGSGDLTNIPLLLQVAGYKRPIILSTGMATLTEIKEAVKTIYSTGNKNLILLHCTSNYPTKYKEVNLRAMEALKKRFNVPIGYSDHTEGIEVAIAAVGMGACVVEKHFTLDRSLPGPDHKASLEPDEFAKMVRSIRNIELAMGDGIKRPQRSELEIKKVARKSIVAARDIQAGEIITKDMLAVKRPGTGIEPKFFSQIIGKRTKVALSKDQVLTWGKLV